MNQDAAMRQLRSELLVHAGRVRFVGDGQVFAEGADQVVREVCAGSGQGCGVDGDASVGRRVCGEGEAHVVRFVVWGDDDGDEGQCGVVM
ncbi:hypothetical protein [Streptomyces sp. Cmuel-A718b]|uniref:hypothetical protein n=1 Tax=Streptomyces sp. Cmuel-A718b TaxID=697328 RepID=UPI00114D0B87|nr:hypothetical protein [Streptomyces sp. Cmuel-A718b]